MGIRGSQLSELADPNRFLVYPRPRVKRRRLLLQPISDVNPRQTMTRLAVHVAERCPKVQLGEQAEHVWVWS